MLALRGRAFGRQLNHEGRVLMNGLNALIKEFQRAAFPFLHGRMQRDAVVFKESGPSPETKSADA
jgi:hypothetical protein